MVMTILGIIYELIKGFVLLLPNIIKLVDAIVEYYVNKNKRIRDAQAALQAAKQKSTQIEMERAQANLIAAQSLRDEGWKINLQQILLMIKETRLSDLLIKMQFCNWDTVCEIYFSEKPDEAKAFQLVELLKTSSIE